MVHHHPMLWTPRRLKRAVSTTILHHHGFRSLQAPQLLVRLLVAAFPELRRSRRPLKTDCLRHPVLIVFLSRPNRLPARPPVLLNRAVLPQQHVLTLSLLMPPPR